MVEELKNDKIQRVLQIYAKLSDGYIVNKAEEALIYGVNERSIQRDIDDIRCFLDADFERTGIINTVVYDRMGKGYRLETLYTMRLTKARFWRYAKSFLIAEPLQKMKWLGCSTS